MKREHIFLIFILFLTFLSIYLLYQILSPFLSSIVWAILLAMISYPLFKKLHNLLKKRGVLSALIMTLLVLVVIVLPLTLLMASLASDVVNLYHQVEEMIKTGQLQAYFERVKEIPILKSVLARVGKHVDFWTPLPLLLKNVNQISTFIFNQTTTLLKGFSTFVAGFFFTLLSLYYLFKDGSHPLREIERGRTPPIQGERPSHSAVQGHDLCHDLWRDSDRHDSGCLRWVIFLDPWTSFAYLLGNSDGSAFLYPHRWNSSDLGPGGYYLIDRRGCLKGIHLARPWGICDQHGR